MMYQRLFYVYDRAVKEISTNRRMLRTDDDHLRLRLVIMQTRDEIWFSDAPRYCAPSDNIHTTTIY